MPRRVRSFAIGCAIVLLTAGLPAPTAMAQAGSFGTETLAPGVTLLRPDGSALGWTNSLIVERNDGLLVVEAQPTPQAALALLESIGKISSAPIRYLVLSHPHAESSGGATAFPASTLIIASAACGEALDDGTYAFDAEMTARAANPDRWSSPARPSPTLRISAQTELADERNPVTLLPMYRAHSVGDLMVELPEHGLLYMGALLSPDRNPYAGDARVSGWLNLLNHVIQRKPDIVVPLRGAAGDLAVVRSQRDSFAWLRGVVELAFIEQVVPEQMSAWVLRHDDIDTRFDTRATPSFLAILADTVVEEARTHRRKRGID